MNEIKTSIF